MNKRFQKGQAMTEMLVASAFVLVPLFLIIPIVGKYIDMQHASISAARYAAWQSTVGESVTDIEISNRVLVEADASILLTAASTECGAGRDLWCYHNGVSMLQDNGSQSITGDVYDVTGITTDVVTGMSTVLNIVANLADFLVGNGTFDVVDNKGLLIKTVTLESVVAPSISGLAKSSTQRLLVGDAPVFSARAGVYALNWGAEGKDDLYQKVQPLVLTAALKGLFDIITIPIVNISGQDLIAGVLLSPEISSSSLVFGYQDLDVLPRDKYLTPDIEGLDSGGDKTRDDGSFVYEREYADDDLNDMATAGDDNLCDANGYCRE